MCRQPIMPEPGQDETVRVVALDRSFHIQCYKCEVRDYMIIVLCMVFALLIIGTLGLWACFIIRGRRARMLSIG